MKKIISYFLLLAVITCFFSSCEITKTLSGGVTKASVYETTGVTQAEGYNRQPDGSHFNEGTSASVGEELSQISDTLSESVSYAPPETVPVPSSAPESTTQKNYEKTGEMNFSDSPDNRYIQAIATKYSVDARLLAALYTVPYNDGNIVLRFDGSVDSSGKLIRNKNTLVAIYTVDKNLVSKCASKNPALNEYEEGEMKGIYFSTTSFIMPKFEAQL